MTFGSKLFRTKRLGALFQRRLWWTVAGAMGGRLSGRGRVFVGATWIGLPLLPRSSGCASRWPWPGQLHASSAPARLGARPACRRRPRHDLDSPRGSAPRCMPSRRCHHASRAARRRRFARMRTNLQARAPPFLTHHRSQPPMLLYASLCFLAEAHQRRHAQREPQAVCHARRPREGEYQPRRPVTRQYAHVAAARGALHA